MRTSVRSLEGHTLPGMAVEQVLDIATPGRPVAGRVRVPASKSLTNRELLLSALADGTSRVSIGELDPGDDVRRMIGMLRAVGIELRVRDGEVEIDGEAGEIPEETARVEAGDAGTVARFGAAFLALGTGPYMLDGTPRLRERPIAPLAQALRALGAGIDGDALPLTISGPATGGEISLPADVSSQFASALLLVAPLLPEGLVLRLIGVPVSAPFVDMTIATMRARGAEAKRSGAEIAVVPGEYEARDVVVEGDATAASYFFAAAAITAGAITVENVTRGSAQGDIRLLGHLAAMGCHIEDDAGVRVRGPSRLRPLEADLGDIADTFPTLAVCCAFADGASELRGVAHARVHESDRVRAVATELRRLGAEVEEFPDGVRITPRPLRGAILQTYRDHRIAMAFSLVGLRVPGVAIADPGCVAKTFPDYFALLSAISASS